MLSRQKHGVRAPFRATSTFLLIVLVISVTSFFHTNLGKEDTGMPSRGNEWGPSRSLQDEDDSGCRRVGSAKDKCEWVKKKCGNITGFFFSYLKLYYCSPNSVSWMVYVLMAFAIFALFFLLGDTADVFFCKTLEYISNALKLSPNVAGVTFLALGNGAPDISSIVAGIFNGSTGIGVGEPLGAGVFVTTIVMSAVSLTCVAQVSKGAFLRDGLFYLFSVLLLPYCFWKKEVTLLESTGFLVYYFVYVGIVIIGHIRSKKSEEKESSKAQQKPRKNGTVDEKTLLLDGSSIQTKDNDSLNDRGSRSDDESVSGSSESLTLEDDEYWLTGIEVHPFWKGIQTLIGWKERSIGSKIIFVIMLPFLFVRAITIPRMEIWNRLMNAIPLIFCPVFLLLLIGEISFSIGGFPLAIGLLVIGTFLSLLLYLLTKDDEPTGFMFSVAVAFSVSIGWIYLFAYELVAILQTMGVMWGVSDTIMSFTVLAWGNSIGDMVADIVVSRQGFPAMAVGAIYGGQMMNLLIGLGIAFTAYDIINYPNSFHVSPDASLILGAITLVTSLLMALIIVPLSSYQSPRWISIPLGVLYAFFMITCILFSFGVI